MPVTFCLKKNASDIQLHIAWDKQLSAWIEIV